MFISSRGVEKNKKGTLKHFGIYNGNSDTTIEITTINLKHLIQCKPHKIDTLKSNMCCRILIKSLK